MLPTIPDAQVATADHACSGVDAARVIATQYEDVLLRAGVRCEERDGKIKVLRRRDAKGTLYLLTDLLSKLS